MSLDYTELSENKAYLPPPPVIYKDKTSWPELRGENQEYAKEVILTETDRTDITFAYIPMDQFDEVPTLTYTLDSSINTCLLYTFGESNGIPTLSKNYAPFLNFKTD